MNGNCVNASRAREAQVCIPESGLQGMLHATSTALDIPSGRAVDHDGARIWNSTYGSGDPVVLLHDGLGHSGNWAAQVLALFARDHRASLIDGHYASLSPTPNDFGAFVDADTLMMQTQPNWSADDLHDIRVPVTIAPSEHEEFI